MFPLWITLAVLLAAMGRFLLLLLTPVVVTVDTRNRQMKIRWQVLLTYFRPLPGARGRRHLYILGIPIPLVSPGRNGERRRDEARPRKRGRQRLLFLGRLLRRCLRETGIRRALAAQLVCLLGGILRSVELARWRSNLSLPDPALNGFLAGILAQPFWGSKARIFVNFTGENALQM